MSVTEQEKREKVIKGLNDLRSHFRAMAGISSSRQGMANHVESARIIEDALALLKAQEPPTIASISSAIECLLHPQDADDSDMAKAIDTAVRAMRLLKAQELVEPIPTSDDDWVCGSCSKSVVGTEDLDASGFVPVRFNFCPNCGRAVKWE